MAVVYHWKHGWIPLDHVAALLADFRASLLGGQLHSKGTAAWY